MLFVLSPAKSLDFSPAAPDIPATRPEAFAKETAELVAAARRLTSTDLSRLMDISDKLADLNHQRFQAFDLANDEEGLQAAFAFDGDVYDGLQARALDAEALDWAQARLRILSGLYGLLRPLDRIQPYRLEMGARLRTPRGATLYDFWGDRIAKALNAAARDHPDPTLVNLASLEYFGAVDARALKLPVLTIRFLEESEGEARIVSFWAKRARGMMARWAIDRRIEQVEGLKRFEGGGYRFDAEASGPGEWTFVRPYPNKTAAEAAAG
jgi:cytoplasmic iron level regulating protein YaaA (DUF328/UPF0246 family)